MYIPGSDSPGGPASDRVPWSIGDVIAGVATLILLTLAMSLAFGSFVRFSDDGLGAEALIFIVAALGATSGAGALTRFKRASATNLTRVTLASMLVTGLLVGFSSGEGVDREIFDAPVELFLTFAIVAVTITVVVTYTVGKHRARWASLGFVAARGNFRTLGAFGIWLAGLASIALVDQLLRLVGIEVLTPPDNASDALDTFGGHVVPALIAVGIFVPIAEEMFFRGFVLSALRNRFGIVAAVLVSAILFALFHVDPGLYLPTFILGVALGAARVWTGSLWPSIMIHMAQNTLALTVAYQNIEL